jgi:hypothetical protein
MTDVLLILTTLGTPLVVLLGVGYVIQRSYQRGERGLALCPAAGPAAGPAADPADAICDTAPRGRAAGRRCWQIKGCSLAERSSCPAYRRPYLPCWLAVELANGGQTKDECLDCARYKSGLVG